MHARIAFSTLDSDMVSGSGPNTFELWALKSGAQSAGGGASGVGEKRFLEVIPADAWFAVRDALAFHVDMYIYIYIYYTDISKIMG